MKTILTAIAFLITATNIWAEPAPARLDLSDCRILDGKLYPQAFNETLAGISKRAQGGSLKDREALAAIANNKFACWMETISDSAGWSMTTYSKDKDNNSGITSTTTNTVSAALSKDAAAQKLLKDAYAAAQALAEDDLAYRNVASSYVADYKEVFSAKEHTTAYKYAASVGKVACQTPDLSKSPKNRFFCTRAKSSLAALYPLLSTSQREQLESEGSEWAEKQLQKSAATQTTR